VFHDFDFNNAAALGDCSHCFHPAATDSGARTYRISKMEYNNTPRRVRYQLPFRGIFLDQDGSTTEKGPNTWMTFDYEWNRQPECFFDDDTLTKYNGVVCDNTVQVRRLSFKAAPDYLFYGMAIKIMRYDDSITKDWVNDIRTNVTTPHLVDPKNWGTGNWKKNSDPSRANTIAIVTGHKYRIHWGKTGINFEDLSVFMD